MNHKQFTSWIVIGSLLIAGIFTINGIVETEWRLKTYYYWPLYGSAVIFFGLSFIWNTWCIRILLCSILLLAICSGHMFSLLACGLFFFSTYLAGQSILKWIGYERASWVESVVAGAGSYGAIIGIAVMFPVNYPGIYALMLLLPIVIRRRATSQCIRSFWSMANNSEDLPRYERFLIVSISAFIFTYFFIALLPEVGHDALATHLFVPSHVYLRHLWGFDPATYVWAVMPMTGDWIYTVGYLLAGESAARLINFGFILINAGLIAEIVRCLEGNMRSRLWAVLIFLSTPLTLTESSSLFIESIWAAFILAGMLAMIRIRGASNSVTVVPAAGLFWGFAAGAKAVTFMYIPGAILYFIYQAYRYRPLNLGVSLIRALFIGLPFGFYPYVVAWIKTGNPVFPFFNLIFKSKMWPPQNFDNPIFNSGFTWDTPYRIIFESGKYLESSAGAAGFQWLLLLLPVIFLILICRRFTVGALLVAAIFMVAAVFSQQSYLRYIFPAFGLLCAILGVMIVYSEQWVSKCLVISGVFVVILNSFTLYSGSPWYSSFPVDAVFSEESRNKYLKDRLPIRKAVDLVNELNLNDAPVPFFSQPFGAGLKADALYVNWYNHTFYAQLMGAKSPSEFASILNGRNVEYIIVDRNWSQWPNFALLSNGIQNITVLVSEIGSVEIRRIKVESLYQMERLTNPALNSLSGWSAAPAVIYDKILGVAGVSLNQSITQAISVVQGQRVLNLVRFRCRKGESGGIVRAQVNWLDDKGGFLSTNITTAPCSSDWGSLSQRLVVPKGAVTAIVYGVSHSEAIIEIDEISFRQ